MAASIVTALFIFFVAIPIGWFVLVSILGGVFSAGSSAAKAACSALDPGAGARLAAERERKRLDRWGDIERLEFELREIERERQNPFLPPSRSGRLQVEAFDIQARLRELAPV
jgi:hypothetical protein